jgi:hypothetical protein
VASQIIPQEYDKEKALQSEALLEGEKLPSTKDVQLSSSHAHEASEAEEEGELGATPPSPVKEAPSTLEQHSTALPKEDSSAEEGSSQNAPSEEAGAVTVPQPILVDILPCTNCKQKPPSYPVYACATCVGEPTICVSCSQSVFSDPKNIHKYHNVRLLASDAWYSMKDMYLPGSTEIAPADAVSQLGWGIQWQQHAITSQDFKLGTMPVTDGAVVFFSPRPSGTFRFLLRNVPAGQYEVKLQVGMWPSTFFGEAQVDELKTLKKLAVKSSMSPIGFIDAHAGCLVADAADRYMTLEPLDPNQVRISLYILTTSRMRSSLRARCSQIIHTAS